MKALFGWAGLRLPSRAARIGGRAPYVTCQEHQTADHDQRRRIKHDLNAGRLRGRVLKEALAGGPASTAFQSKVLRSKPSESGKSTVLMYQEAGGVRYLDEADLK